jgi:hypothetical protein
MSFCKSILPNISQLLEVSPDGNCLFRCISDQLNYDEGARHEFTHHQITNHISRNGDAFKNFLLLQDHHENISNLDSYNPKMKQDGAWGGHPEVYAAAWFYCINITIYAQEYTSTGRCLIFKGDGPDANCNADRPMWFLSYHGNNHYNSIRTPGNPLQPIQHIAIVKHYQANLQSALEDYHDNYEQLMYSSIIDNAPILPRELGSIWEITRTIMSYVAAQLLEAGGKVIPEEQMADLCTHAEGRATVWACTASTTPPLDSTPLPDAPSLAQTAAMQDESDPDVQLPNKQKSSMKAKNFFPFSLPLPTARNPSK